MTDKIAAVMDEMIRYYTGNTHQIMHHIKVHCLSALIARQENVEEETGLVIEAAALLHDIGVRDAKAQYGENFRPYHEAISAAEAERILRGLDGWTEEQITAVAHICGNHHHYQKIDSLAFRIVVEGDLLVNLQELPEKYGAILASEDALFRTESGKRLLNIIFPK